ncbi:SDR family oxidoreductase [Solihabitans fulvus]|uniref:SDR family oxidoreductase n=1 Tax=Solihabitans fulvus TaxID=1892852 RepID=A0A5B2WMV0_9PSEU|nr:SDR family oxidoreductase [Solihabitans fulvus]KAA2253091.1 SDR family oxidoreductase [Solihabitans fulvus]
MGKLDDRAALVTGGSRGIGRAIVERLASEGASVVLAYRSNQQQADEVVARVSASGRTAYAVQADLADLGQLRELVGAAGRLLGRLDILVNNAADASAATIATATEEHYDHVMAVNAKATFFTLHYALPLLTDGACVINVSSLNTTMASPGSSVYAASKAAVEHFTAAAAHELGARGITVNCIAPGATDTDLLNAVHPEPVIQALARATPLGRLGHPRDIAAVVAFLVGPDGRWVNGQCIRVNGGIR